MTDKSESSKQFDIDVSDSVDRMTETLCELRQEWQPGHQYNYPIVNSKACGSCISIMAGLMRSDEFGEFVGGLIKESLQRIVNEQKSHG